MRQWNTSIINKIFPNNTVAKTNKIKLSSTSPN